VQSLYGNRFFGRPSLRSLVDCLVSSHQIVTVFDVAKIAALKVGIAPGNLHETVTLIDAFEELGVLKEQRANELIWAVNHKILTEAHIPFGSMNLNLQYYTLRNRFRYELNTSIAEWLRRNTLSSDKGANISSAESPVVSLYGVPFDVVAFCFVRGIARRPRRTIDFTATGERTGRAEKQQDISPSPLVGDCLIEECNLAYAHSFFRRIREAAAVKNTRAPIPFIFAKRFVHEAFTFLKEQGVLIWTHSQLMGTTTAEAIQRILSISEDIVAQQNLNPQLFTELFEGFENFQGVFGQLKGKLFELLMAYFFQRHFSDTRLGWQIDNSEFPDDRKKEVQEFDVDIAAFQDADAVIVECKGIKMDGEVAEGEVVKHFTKRLPLARRILLTEKGRPIHKFKAIVITTGGFEDVALMKYKNGDYQARQDTNFELWDRARLLEELQAAEQKELISIVDKYYQ
jgi:hypothetical protein